jgi:hypothetical protein
VEIETERLIMRPVRVEDVGAFLGRSGLRFWPEFDETEVGWVLMPEARGRGVATEVGRACVELGFRDFALPYSPDNTKRVRRSPSYRGKVRTLRDERLGYAARAP